jgi:hypothetical protein
MNPGGRSVAMRARAASESATTARGGYFLPALSDPMR